MSLDNRVRVKRPAPYYCAECCDFVDAEEAWNSDVVPNCEDCGSEDICLSDEMVRCEVGCQQWVHYEEASCPAWGPGWECNACAEERAARFA